MIEMPPILEGDEKNQIRQIHDWLVRLVLQLNEEENND